MIQRIDAGHENVMGFRVNGDIEEKEVSRFQRELRPEPESDKKFNLYIEISASDCTEPTAIQERVSLLLSNLKEILKKINKLAFVTDKDCLLHLSHDIFTISQAIEFKYFSFEEIHDARE